MRMHSYQGHLQICLGAEFLAQTTWTKKEWNIARWSYVLCVFFLVSIQMAQDGRSRGKKREGKTSKGQWRKNNNEYEDEEKQRNKTEVLLVLNKDLLVAYKINRPSGTRTEATMGASYTHKEYFQQNSDAQDWPQWWPSCAMRWKGCSSLKSQVWTVLSRLPLPSVLGKPTQLPVPCTGSPCAYM